MAHPVLERTPTHRRHRKIEHRAKRAGIIVSIQRTHQFQVAERTRVERHVIVQIQNLERRKVRQFGLFLVDQILKQCARHGRFKNATIQAKAIKRFNLEVRKQHILCLVFCKQNSREFSDQDVFRLNQVHNRRWNRRPFGNHNFLGHAAAEFAFKSLHTATARRQVTRRHIGNCKRSYVPVSALAVITCRRHISAKVICLFCIEVFFVHRRAGADDFNNVALDNALRQFRVFDLFANGDAVAGSHHLWHIAFSSVVREPAQRCCTGGAIIAARER